MQRSLSASRIMGAGGDAPPTRLSLRTVEREPSASARFSRAARPAALAVPEDEATI